MNSGMDKRPGAERRSMCTLAVIPVCVISSALSGVLRAILRAANTVAIDCARRSAILDHGRRVDVQPPRRCSILFPLASWMLSLH